MRNLICKWLTSAGTRGFGGRSSNGLTRTKFMCPTNTNTETEEENHEYKHLSITSNNIRIQIFCLDLSSDNRDQSLRFVLCLMLFREALKAQMPSKGLNRVSIVQVSGVRVRMGAGYRAGQRHPSLSQQRPARAQLFIAAQNKHRCIPIRVFQITIMLLQIGPL